MVKGVSAGQRAQLKTIGADTPLRSLARLCEEAGDDGEKAALIPPLVSLKNQRRQYLKSDGARDVPVSQSVLL